MDWEHEVGLVWEALKDYFEIAVTATHIHILPLVALCNTQTLSNLAKAIIFFDPVFKDNFPVKNKQDKHAAGNTDAPKVAQIIQSDNSKPHISIFKEIDAILEGGPDLDRLINYLSPTCRFAWSFNNISTGGNIEYRQPPGSQNPEDAIKHIKFTKLFVEKVINWDEGNIPS